MHPDVDPATLYKHVSATLPPVLRMRHVVGWAAQRRLDQLDHAAKKAAPGSLSTACVRP